MAPAHGGRIGNPPYVPTDDDREFVVQNAAKRGYLWTALQLGISKTTLHQHFRTELDMSNANACAEIGQSLYQKAIDGDGASQRFFLITRGKGEWSPKVKHEHSGPDGGPMQSVDLTAMLEGKTDDELRSILAALELLSASGGGDITGSD